MEMAASVTYRVYEVKQPRGGYVRPRSMSVRELAALPPHPIDEESIHPSLVGIATDYLTRLKLGADIDEAFRISLRGAARIGQTDSALVLRNFIRGLDDQSVKAACKLVGYDSVVRAGASTYRPMEDIIANSATCENIRAMVESTSGFLESAGPLVSDGFTFLGGYTETIPTGDGDYLTEDAIWDVKVSVKPPTTKHTLQLAIYWLMGMHSFNTGLFHRVERLGIINPRLGKVYTIETSAIPAEALHEIEVDVIGYEEGLTFF